MQSPEHRREAGSGSNRSHAGFERAGRRAERCAAVSSGFTLLELVVVMAILALLAGAAVPVARRLVDSAARRATRAELDVLADAAAEYFRDTWRFPAKLEDLLEDPGTSGWTGPYVEVTGRDADGRSDALLDGWSRPYVLVREGESRLRIASRRIDAASAARSSNDKEREELGGARRELEIERDRRELEIEADRGGLEIEADRGELEIELDVTPIRRARTLESLRTLNAALERYLGEHPGESLPPDAGAILLRLVKAGCLPASEPWSRDGWGEPLVCDPPNATPVVRLTSRRFLR